jgi:adenosylcobinamide-phosphate synthase
VTHVAAGGAVAAAAGEVAAVAAKRLGGHRGVATALTVTVVVGGRSLDGAAVAVRDALAAGDLDAARVLVRSLVGRRTDDLDAAEIVRAVIESVAENTVDAVIAPVLWAWAGGPSAAAAYRAVNTLDAMVGHRSDRYRNFGWASARLDDAVNFVPGRGAAVLVALVRPARSAAIWRAVRHDAPSHPSPNAGVVEAAFAAALGVRLGGTNIYGDHVEDRVRLGTGAAPSVADIDRARALARDVTVALSAVIAAGSLITVTRRRRLRAASIPARPALNRRAS